MDAIRTELQELTNRLDRQQALLDLIVARLETLVTRAGIGQVLKSVDQAAEALGISPHTLYKRAEQGQIQSVKDGSRLLFREEDIRAYIENRIVEAEPRSPATPETVSAMATRIRQGSGRKSSTRRRPDDSACDDPVRPGQDVRSDG